MVRENNSQQRLRAEMQAFRDGFDNLVLATVSSAGVPEASAVAMVRGDTGEFYIYVSALAQHTANLESNPRAGVLLIRDPQSASSAFARERLSYRCRADRVARDSKRFEAIMRRFGERFGAIMETLRKLADFQLICLTPESGTYVRGFAQAWRLSGPELDDLEHINPARDA